MTTLRELLKHLRAGPGTVICVADGPVSPETPATLVAYEATTPRSLRPPAGFRPLLESELAVGTVEVWSKWRAGRKPTTDEAIRAILYYAENDAHLPTERERPQAHPDAILYRELLADPVRGERCRADGCPHDRARHCAHCAGHHFELVLRRKIPAACLN
jgi:hypothetical protein